jgi:hypothetical protein
MTILAVKEIMPPLGTALGKAPVADTILCNMIEWTVSN